MNSTAWVKQDTFSKMDPLYKIKNGFRRCPYNTSHSVLALRFIGHLLKCAKRSPFKLMVCPWNATHHIFEEHYEVHMATCESQELLEGMIEMAVPDSAFVRDYKMMKYLNNSNPGTDVVTMGGDECYYDLEVYNRRLQTQEFCNRGIDEFDNPPSNGNSNAQFDLYGNILASEVSKVDILPSSKENSYDVANNRHYYGRQLREDTSDQDSRLQTEIRKPNHKFLDHSYIALDSTNKFLGPFKNTGQSELPLQSNAQTKDRFPIPASLRSCPALLTGTLESDPGSMTSLRLQGGETGQYSSRTTMALVETEADVPRPTTTLGKNAPTYLAMSRGPEGALRPGVGVGRGRAYRLQKLLQQSDVMSDPGDASRPSCAAGQGRGLRLKKWAIQQGKMADPGDAWIPSSAMGQGRGKGNKER